MTPESVEMSSVEDKPMAQAHGKMINLMQNRKMKGDERLIRYNQEFKRYNKFFQDKEHKPIRVQSVETAPPQSFFHPGFNPSLYSEPVPHAHKSAYEEVLEHILQNSDNYQVDHQLRLLNRRQLPIRNSNVVALLDYHFGQTPYGIEPAGYPVFLERLAPYFEEHGIPTEARNKPLRQIVPKKKKSPKKSPTKIGNEVSFERKYSLGGASQQGDGLASYKNVNKKLGVFLKFKPQLW